MNKRIDKHNNEGDWFISIAYLCMNSWILFWHMLNCWIMVIFVVELMMNYMIYMLVLAWKWEFKFDGSVDQEDKKWDYSWMFKGSDLRSPVVNALSRLHVSSQRLSNANRISGFIFFLIKLAVSTTYAATAYIMVFLLAYVRMNMSFLRLF